MPLFIIHYSLFIFLFGLCVGSFLNVVIDWSVGKRKSLFTPPSYCDHCQHQLGFWDLIPVFSFIFLRGRCRYCGKRISLQYPLVELATGILFCLSLFPPPPRSPFGHLGGVLLFSTLIVVFVTDIKYGIIPDRVILPAIALSLSYSLFITLPAGRQVPYSLFAALVTSAAFMVLYWLTRGKGLGLGDVKLSFFLGLTLGFPYVILALWVAFVLGGLVATTLLILGKKKLKDEIPLGPFLVIGGVLTMFLGELIIGAK